MASFTIPSTTLPPGTYPSSAFSVPQGTTKLEMQLDLPAGDRVDPTVSMAGAIQTAPASGGPWSPLVRITFTGAPNCPIPGPHYTVSMGSVSGTLFIRGQLEVLGRATTVGATVTTT